MILSAEPYLLTLCSFLCFKGSAKLNLLAISYVQSVHMCMHVCVCLCGAQSRGQQRILGILFYHPLSHFLGMGLPLNSELGLAASKAQQPIAGPVSHTTGMDNMRPCLAFYPGAEDLNSDLHVSQQMFLPVEPSPFPNNVNLMVLFINGTKPDLTFVSPKGSWGMQGGF